MACGACAKAKLRRKAALEARRAAAAKKQEEKKARALAAKQAQTQTLQIQQEPIKEVTEESA